MWFTVYKKNDNENVLYDMTYWGTIEEAKNYVLRKYGEEYYCTPDLEYDPVKDFDYEAFDNWCGAPSKEQLMNAEMDSQYERRLLEEAKHNKATKCVDCGVQVTYTTRPFKRCVECKRKFERERVHRARKK